MTDPKDNSAILDELISKNIRLQLELEQTNNYVQRISKDMSKAMKKKVDRQVLFLLFIIVIISINAGIFITTVYSSGKKQEYVETLKIIKKQNKKIVKILEGNDKLLEKGIKKWNSKKKKQSSVKEKKRP